MPKQDDEKYPPIHPGGFLKEDFLVPMGISQYRLAKSIGVDPRRINAIVQGKRAITAETAIKLSQFFGTSANLWMGIQTDYDLNVAMDKNGCDAPRIRGHPRRRSRGHRRRSSASMAAARPNAGRRRCQTGHRLTYSACRLTLTSAFPHSHGQLAVSPRQVDRRGPPPNSRHSTRRASDHYRDRHALRQVLRHIRRTPDGASDAIRPRSCNRPHRQQGGRGQAAKEGVGGVAICLLPFRCQLAQEFKCDCPVTRRVYADHLGPRRHVRDSYANPQGPRA